MRITSTLLLLLLTPPPSWAVRNSPVDYLRDVKPILAKHCYGCHGPGKQQNGLRLDSAASAIQGGITGPAVVAGKASQSLIWLAINGKGETAKMPPEGTALTNLEMETLRDWIDQGAGAPEEQLAKDARANHWSLITPRQSNLPLTNDKRWPHNAIDSFILAQLEQRGLSPSGEADRSAQIRRLSLDLLGLPPTPSEVNAFLSDQQPDAYKRLVDRLLASPRYGERWGRHWLDLARYADSNGFTRDFGREIWKYRDWVIEALNRNLPFDQFTIAQIAGDLLPNATIEQVVATGFHRNTLINEEGGTDDEQFRVDAVADRVATSGIAFLGLTLGCARCHEHKFDPISQREYYQLFAFLNDCDEPEIEVPSKLQLVRGEVRRRDAIREQIGHLRKELDVAPDEFMLHQLAWEETITPELRAKLPGPLQAALDRAPDSRTRQDKGMVKEHFLTTDHALRTIPVVARIRELKESEPVIPTTMVMRQRQEPRKTFVHRRGNFLDHGVRVFPAVPAALHSLPQDVVNPSRLDFARWLVSRDNPLTARVVVNRYWQRFFGRGLVFTENDFGLQGTPPTHPELLDWLAVEFMWHKWNVKAIHRLIVMSATYRQSSFFPFDLQERDPDNKLLARQSRIRLEAEIIRDSALTVGGLLTNVTGGPSVFPPQPEGVFEFTQDPKPWDTSQNGQRYRRGMYTHLWRSSPYPALMTFDFPESNTACTRRVRSNTPTQSLVLANDITFIECARELAQRLVADIDLSNPARMRLAFRSCLSRDPEQDELQRLTEFLDNQKRFYAGYPKAAAQLAGSYHVVGGPIAVASWTAACRVLINLDEFVTRP